MMSNSHSSFLLAQDLGDNQRNLGSNRRFKTDKRKSYVKRMDCGPCPCKKMAWILEAKRNSEDDQIRAREAPMADTNRMKNACKVAESCRIFVGQDAN